MIRAFIDASVLFAAGLSRTGASREIIRQAVRGKVTLVASKLVYEEPEKNLADKAPEALDGSAGPRSGSRATASTGVQKNPADSEGGWPGWPH